jgi:hypothetical protein
MDLKLNARLASVTDTDQARDINTLILRVYAHGKALRRRWRDTITPPPAGKLGGNRCQK